MILTDASSRVADQSRLGQHLALVAIDGVGELAIGLCLYRRSKPPKPREAVLAMLDRLLEDLGHPDAPGVQGFRDLHVIRNQVQHRGILPATDQVPQWLQETEDLIRFLVRTCFGVELGDIGSASSVADEQLRGTLRGQRRPWPQAKSRNPWPSLGRHSNWRALVCASARD